MSQGCHSTEIQPEDNKKMQELLKKLKEQKFHEYVHNEIAAKFQLVIQIFNRDLAAVGDELFKTFLNDQIASNNANISELNQALSKRNKIIQRVTVIMSSRIEFRKEMEGRMDHLQKRREQLRSRLDHQRKLYNAMCRKAMDIPRMFDCVKSKHKKQMEEREKKLYVINSELQKIDNDMAEVHSKISSIQTHVAECDAQIQMNKQVFDQAQGISDEIAGVNESIAQAKQEAVTTRQTMEEIEKALERVHVDMIEINVNTDQYLIHQSHAKQELLGFESKLKQFLEMKNVIPMKSNVDELELEPSFEEIRESPQYQESKKKYQKLVEENCILMSDVEAFATSKDEMAKQLIEKQAVRNDLQAKSTLMQAEIDELSLKIQQLEQEKSVKENVVHDAAEKIQREIQQLSNKLESIVAQRLEKERSYKDEINELNNQLKLEQIKTQRALDNQNENEETSVRTSKQNAEAGRLFGRKRHATSFPKIPDVAAAKARCSVSKIITEKPASPMISSIGNNQPPPVNALPTLGTQSQRTMQVHPTILLDSSSDSTLGFKNPSSQRHIAPLRSRNTVTRQVMPMRRLREIESEETIPDVALECHALINADFDDANSSFDITITSNIAD